MSETATAATPVQPGATTATAPSETAPATQTPTFAMPEKFKGKSAEDIARSYVELESHLGKKSAPAAEPAQTTPGEMKIGGEPLPETADVPTILQKAGLKEAEVAKHFTEKGDLSDEQYAAIKKVRPNLTKADIKFIAEGHAAKAMLRAQAMERVAAEAATIAGGKDKLDTLLREAETFVPAGERAGFDKLLDNPATAPAAIRTLMQMHKDHVGAGGSQDLVSGQPSSSVNHGITTIAEYKDVTRRAVAGDKAAAAIILSIDVSKLKN